MSLTVWCRPNQFNCQSYPVNRSFLFNQSPCVFHLDLYLANWYFFFWHNQTPFSHRRIITQLNEGRNIWRNRQFRLFLLVLLWMVPVNWFVLKLLTVFLLILEPPSEIKFKAGFNEKKALFGKILIYNIWYTSPFSLSKLSFVITILIVQFYVAFFHTFQSIYSFATSWSFVKGLETESLF